ncbi:hypothetical protein [Dictyobacter arantiisoli]|uniref:Uncharacterized protein n=1 Tax=Dictyobacter arantiisoli TaxID=2014874 RepID=A0A5A5TIA3_9CHLR|nr:hypothetical protein [Dictyobacter arantiisoli]GCF11052.1 hypothetical protein KDI_46160 [Dictyobacter arantiisoli]
MPNHSTDYPANTGDLAHASDEDKKKRLDAMVRIWQADIEKRCQPAQLAIFSAANGLDAYRYVVALRFPEWERSAVVGQVITLQHQANGQDIPILFSQWRHEPLLCKLPDWKQQLPDENVFNIAVRLTPGGLGEGSKWAIAMPKELIPRYRPGWPTQAQWVAWTNSFDWLAVATPFIHTMLDTLPSTQIH